MALERLKSVFNNIEDNKQSLDDGIPVESISNSVNDDIHSFGTQGNRSELISITKINKKQNPSPLIAIHGDFDEDGNLTPMSPINGHNFRQIRINDNAGTNLLQTVGTEYSGDAGFGEVISNKPDLKLDKLGKGKYKLESLFDPTHGNILRNTNSEFLRAGIGSRRNLNIKAHDTFSRRGFGFIREPYITHNIPDKDSPGGTKAGYNRDSIPWRAAAEDVLRLGAYYTSPKGLLKLAAENITNLAVGDGFTPAEPFGSLLLPAFPIPMTGFLNAYQQSKQGKFQGIEFSGKLKEVLKMDGIPGLSTFSIRKPGVRQYSSMVKSQFKRPIVLKVHGDGGDFDGGVFDKLLKKSRRDTRLEVLEIRKSIAQSADQVNFDAEKSFMDSSQPPIANMVTPQPSRLAKLKEGAQHLKVKLQNVIVEKAREAAKKLDELPPIDQPTKRFLDLSGGGKLTKYVDNLSNDKSLLGTITPDPPLESAVNPKLIDRGDFYVRIKDLRNSNFIYFRGYVTGITENLTPSWNPTTYIGRSEDVWIYQKGERDLSFNLRVAPANATEFGAMYDKMNKLTSLIYPEYSSLNRMTAPFTELYMAHIGHPTAGQFGYIKSLTYTVNEQGDWDALSSKPRVFDIALSYQILHKKPPESIDIFYGEEKKSISDSLGSIPIPNIS